MLIRIKDDKCPFCYGRLDGVLSYVMRTRHFKCVDCGKEWTLGHYWLMQSHVNQDEYDACRNKWIIGYTDEIDSTKSLSEAEKD